MKYLFSTILFSFFLITLNAQDCENTIFQARSETGAPQTETIKQVLAAKGTWFYGVALVKNDYGTFAKVYNVSGVNLKKGDEIIFMDDTRKRVKFTLMNPEVKKNLDGSEYHENYIKLDKKNLNWFSSKPMQSIYIKNNDINEMRRFDIDANRQQAFLNIVRCFQK